MTSLVKDFLFLCFGIGLILAGIFFIWLAAVNEHGSTVFYECIGIGIFYISLSLILISFVFQRYLR